MCKSWSVALSAPALLLLLAAAVAPPATAGVEPAASTGPAEPRRPVLVAPMDADAALATEAGALARAVEGAVRKHLKGQDIVTPQAVQARLAADELGTCDATSDSCLADIAAALSAEWIFRPQLTRLGDELVLGVTVVSGQRMVLLAQASRRAPVTNAGALLDATDALVASLARQLGVPGAPRPTPWPAIGTVAGGAAAAGLGTALLVVRGRLSGPYTEGRLSRDDARLYEAINQPTLWTGIGLAVAGGLAVVGGCAWWIVDATSEEQ